MTMRGFPGIVLFSLLFNAVFAQSTDPPPTFEVADVHTSPYRAIPFMDGGNLRGDRYVLRQATMVNLIATAYGVDANNVQGGPAWLETDRFDVIAKAPPTTSKEALKLMLQSLLADRFKLVTHNGSAPIPALVLSAGKGPPKMKQAEDSGEGSCQYQEPPPNAAPGSLRPVEFSCHHITVEAFTRNLHNWTGRTDSVVDATGLKGSWDFDIKWTPQPLLQRAGADGISIFDAVDKQLGLKLERQTAPRPVLIVDSVNQKPTANPPGLEKSLPPPPPPQFDVAVIKPSKPGTPYHGKMIGGEVDVTGAPLKFLITSAWDLDSSDEEALVGAPKWLETDHFDILAKVVNDGPAVNAGAEPKAPRIDAEDLRQMLQALLADRFHLKAHMEERPVSAYTLIAVKPKLTKADPLSRTRCKDGPGPDGKDPRIANPILNRLVSCQNMTMAQLGEELQRMAPGYIHSPVLDSTGLKGSWDFTLSFSSAVLTQAGAHIGPPPAAPAATSSTVAASDPNGAVSLFDAVSKQLGLKLEKQRRPAPVLVIDYIEEKPTEN